MRERTFVANIRHTTTESNIYTGQKGNFRRNFESLINSRFLQMENILREFPISYLFVRFLFADSWNTLRSDGIFSFWPELKAEGKVLKYSGKFFLLCGKSFLGEEKGERSWNPIWNLIDKRTKWSDSLLFHLKLLTFGAWAEVENYRPTSFSLWTHLWICVWVHKLSVDA